MKDAGIIPVSFLSILAGTLVAFASFAVLLAIVGAILALIGIETATLTANDLELLGIGSAIVAGLVLFVSYFFGGYIAGRLARRAGALHGGLVLVLAIVIGGVVAVLVGTQAATQTAALNLRVIGVPTTGADFTTIATVAGVVTLLAMIAGAVLGGIKGERWHAKLATRAFDPNVGPESVARREMAEAEHRRTDDRDRPATEPEQTEQTEQSGHRARRPWDRRQKSTQDTPTPVPAYRQEHGQTPADRPSPADAPAAPSDWSDAESRAWGTPQPMATPSPQPTTGQPTTGQPGAGEPAAGEGPVLTEEREARPRRERPLRSGRRS